MLTLGTTRCSCSRKSTCKDSTCSSNICSKTLELRSSRTMLRQTRLSKRVVLWMSASMFAVSARSLASSSSATIAQEPSMPTVWVTSKLALVASGNATFAKSFVTESQGTFPEWRQMKDQFATCLLRHAAQVGRSRQLSSLTFWRTTSAASASSSRLLSTLSSCAKCDAKSSSRKNRTTWIGVQLA